MISTTPFFMVRGSPIRTRLIVEGYIENNWKVDLVTYPVGEDIFRKGLNIIRPNTSFYTSLEAGPSLKKPFIDFLVLIKAARLIWQNNYDIIHCEDSEAAFMGAILKMMFKKPTIVNFHNRLSDNLRLHNCNALVGLGKFVEHMLYNNADSIIANSEGLKQLLVKKYNVNNATVVLDLITADESEPGLDLPDSYIAYSGTSAPYQGIPLLLSAFRRVIKEYPDLTLVLMGDMSEEVKKIAGDLGVNDNIIMSGTLNIEETNYVLKRSLFNVLPRVGGIQPGMKALHYLANGVPILATNLKCNRGFLKHGTNAYLAKPDEKSFAEGILTLMRNASIRSKLRQNIVAATASQNIPQLLRKAAETAINRKIKPLVRNRNQKPV